MRIHIESEDDINLLPKIEDVKGDLMVVLPNGTIIQHFPETEPNEVYIEERNGSEQRLVGFSIIVYDAYFHSLRVDYEKLDKKSVKNVRILL